MKRLDPFLIEKGKMFPEYRADWQSRWKAGTGRMALPDTSRRTQLCYTADKRKRGIK